MQFSQLPVKWFKPFAVDDANKVEIPVTTATLGRASQSLGFPPITMQPPESGGLPPQGEDFNGAMNQVARLTWWGMAGGPLPFDATWAANAAITGYPQGARIAAADLLGEWISTVDNNTVNPDTTGTGWVPGSAYGATALAGLTNANVTLTPAQAAKPVITLAGTLTGNIQIILPVWRSEWLIVNNTTGAFSVTVKTAAGAGVVVSQAGGQQTVWGDGTNINALGGNAAVPLVVGVPTLSTHAVQLAQTTGRLLRTLVYLRVAGVQNVIVDGAAATTTGASTYVPAALATFVTVEVQGAGSGGAGSSGAAAGNVSMGAPGSSGSYALARHTVATIGASQTITVGAGSAGSSGAAGGTSSVGALTTAPGGNGSAQLANQAPPSFNGTGAVAGAPTGANLVSITGRSPFVSVGLSATAGYGGAGGTSQFGQGAAGPSINTAGVNAVNPGSGGSGTVVNQSGGTATGGNGADGIIIVREYA